MVNLGPLTAEIDWGVWGTSCSKFQRVSCLGFVTALTSLNGGQPHFARCFAVYWAGTLYIHFLGLLLLTEFCQVHNSLCVQVLRSPTARHASSRRLGVSQTLRRGTRSGTTELLLLVIFVPGSESPLTEFRQLENSLQMEQLRQLLRWATVCPQDMGRKLGGGCCAPFLGRSWFPI